MYGALSELGAAPTANPAKRPHGPLPEDATLLLGVLLAHAELDAAARADPAAGSPSGLADVIVGYNAVLGADSDVRLRLMSLRLVRTAAELTGQQIEPVPIAEAASCAALSASCLVDALRLAKHSSSPAAEAAALKAAAKWNRQVHSALRRMASTGVSRRAE
ncbi:hypothetical protein ACPA54_12910 [Uniformispora flossi]|uniref:hypothetical protein n=1 Tax=Uniformispora flossi TaxID=3390723 RepID=UPI003C2D0436